MEIELQTRFHGPHLPTAVRKRMPKTNHEIESAINDFLDAAAAFSDHPNQENAERVWDSGRSAWGLLLPHRRHFLESNRILVERFRDGVKRLRELLHERSALSDDFSISLRDNLARRELLISALLSRDAEPRIRELLAAERTMASQS